MKYADVVYAAPGDAPAGMPSQFPLKGFRVVPILAATATIADVLQAYESLVIRVQRSSNARQQSGVAPVGITDDVSVVGPDWVRSPGFNALSFQSGRVGVTYRVWWAEDCYEVVDPGSVPMAYGFSGGGSSSAVLNQQAAVGPAGAGTQAQLSAANIPSLSTDGLVIPPGTKGALATIAAPVGQTINAAGALVWWRWVAALSRWAELAVQEVVPVGRRDAGGAEQFVLACYPGDRLYVEARNVGATGAGGLVVTLTTA